MNTIYIALEIMGLGMTGIFTAMLIIMAFTIIMKKTDHINQIGKKPTEPLPKSSRAN